MQANVAVAYGAFELKKTYQRNLWRSLVAAALFHLLLIGGFLLYGVISRADEDANIRVIRSLSELGPPPTLTKDKMPQINIVPPEVIPPSVGVPKPVPDEKKVEQVMATQKELERLVPDPSTGTGDVQIQIPEDALPGFGDFVPVEVVPKAVFKVEAAYPELARRAGLTATLRLQLIVDKEGKVRDVRVLKCSTPNVGFEQAAVEAVKQWTFSPAIQNGKPVAVSTTLPYTFTLK